MAEQDRELEQVSLLSKRDGVDSSRDEDDLLDEMDRLNGDAAGDEGVIKPSRPALRRRR